MLLTCEGGRGAFSGRTKTGDRGLQFSNGFGKPSKKLHPAYMNRTKNTGNVDKVIKDFNEKHAKKK